MSRKLLIAALVAVGLIMVLYSCSFTPAKAQTSTQSSGIFRDFVWGVSMEDVRSYETAIFYKKEGNSLYFLLPRNKKYTPSLKPMIRYDFEDDQLVAAEYSYFELNQPSGEIVLDLFTRHEMELTAKFGKPVKEEYNWKNEMYKNFPQLWANALYLRDLWLRTTWEYGNTEIVLQTYREKGAGYVLAYKASKMMPKEEAPRDILQLDIVPQARP